MATSKRDALVETALDLFYRGGFNATGIDKIVAESGVAKMTLYNHFRSKEELIEAALRRRDADFRDWLMAYVERNAATPRDRLLALFDAHGEWFAEKGYRGCAFINAAAEFDGISDSISAIAAEHKRMVATYVRGLAAATGVANPDRLADQIALLLDGAIACSQVLDQPDWAAKARDAAEILIDQEMRPAA